VGLDNLTEALQLWTLAGPDSRRERSALHRADLVPPVHGAAWWWTTGGRWWRLERRLHSGIISNVITCVIPDWMEAMILKVLQISGSLSVLENANPTRLSTWRLRASLA
jgi:hypothetical protein